MRVPANLAGFGPSCRGTKLPCGLAGFEQIGVRENVRVFGKSAKIWRFLRKKLHTYGNTVKKSKERLEPRIEYSLDFAK